MDSDADTDTVIGLDVRGQVFYCNKSKLLNVNNGNSYFSARFREDSMLDAGLDRVDDEGRDIYKLDRDPTVFKYIMEYIDTDTKPKGIGIYETNKKLWELVRDEALYFGLDHLIQLLRITFSCSPEDDGDKGIMYWLGTKKGTSDYDNPYIRGAVYITTHLPNRSKGTDNDMKIMVQYRPTPEGNEINSILEQVADANEVDSGLIYEIFSEANGVMMGCYACNSDNAGGSINFHLRDGVAISPTHYSIRSGGCHGMAGDWNLEASTDGRTWDVLHEARGRQPKLYGGANENDDDEYIWDMALKCEGTESRKEAVCDFMEEHHRQTWQVNNTAGNIYTYFRFVSIEVPEEVDDDDPLDENYRETCLHGIGFEVYGDVYEDCGEETKTRLEQLEEQNEKLQSQNKALLSEVELLKARVQQLENKRNAEEA